MARQATKATRAYRERSLVEEIIHPGYEATTSDTGFLVITRVEAARPKRKGPPIRETAGAGAGPEQV